MNSLWEKMAENNVALIAFKAYSKYLDKNKETFSEDDYLGIKFVCINAWNKEGSSMNPEDKFYIYSEDSAGRRYLIGDTPEEAIKKYLKED